MILERIRKNKVAKNAGWIIAGKVINMLLSFFVGLLTARYLGPNNYGLINYANAYTTFFFSLCTLGINSIIVKEFTDNPDKTGEIIGSTLVLRGISSILSFGIILGISSFADAGEPLTIIVVALCSLGLVFQVFDTFNYWFQYKLLSKYCAISTTIAYIIVSGYRIVLLATKKDVTWFAVSSSLDHIIVTIILAITYKKHGGSRISFSTDRCRELLKKSHHFILAGLMVSIYGATDKLMLKQMLDEASVGYYATAVAVCNTWVFVLSAIIDSMNPVIMEKYKNDNNGYIRDNKRLYAIVFYISIIVSLGFVLLSEPIIRILYGVEYLPSSAPLRIITWYTAFSYLGVARNAWIVCEDKQRYLKYLYIGAAITNVLLNMVFIPSFGASGAALASLITQITTVLVFPAMIKELRPNAKMMIEAIAFRNIK